MRRFIAAVALAALATTANASEWKKVGESSSVGDLLADMDSVTRTGDTVSVWLEWPTYHSNYDPRVASALMQTKFYCRPREFELFNMIVKDKDANVLFNMTDDEGRKGAQANTTFSHALEILCAATEQQH